MSGDDRPTEDATTNDGPTGGDEVDESTHGAAVPPEERTAPGTTDAERADASHDPDRSETGDADDGRGPSDGVALAVSLLFGLALAAGSVLLVSWLDPSFEGLLRVRPTVAGGGIGAGWVAGNADPALNILITLVHLADVVMGLFILVMVFVHWAAFRRLAARMQPPGERTRQRRTPATDGGAPEGPRAPDGDGASDRRGDRE